VKSIPVMVPPKAVARVFPLVTKAAPVIDAKKKRPQTAATIKKA
jgi:hypothetical protein